MTQCDVLEVSMFVGNEIFLKVLFFNFIKLESIAAELAVSFPNPKIGIIPDHRGNSFTHLII